MQNLFLFKSKYILSDSMSCFYAVARGRNPGIYSTWEECKAEVYKFPAPVYKKFPTKIQAENFVASQVLSSSFTPKSAEEIYRRKNSPDKKSEINSLHDEMERRLKDWAKSREELSRVDIQVQASKIAAQLGIGEFNPLGGWLKYHVECNPTIYKALRVRNSVSGDSSGSATSERNKKFFDKLGSLESKISGLSSTSSSSVASRIKFLESTLLSMNRELHEIKRSMSTDVRETADDAPDNRKRKKLSDTKDEENSDDAFDAIDLRELEPLDKFNVDSDGYVNVYTDGACSGNGKFGAAAGIGVWFGDDHYLNVSQPVAKGSRATNNLAEIQAVTVAARQASKAGIKKLRINTDSQFLISCITQWMPKWKRNGWKTSGGKDVINKVELTEMETAIKPLTIAWNHVRGHAGIHGNEMADKLARAGAEQHRK